MENVKYFFRNLLIIIALLIPSLLVIVVKALEWMAKRICACVRRIFQFFNPNAAAVQRREPTKTVRISDNGTVPVESGNIESRRVMTASQMLKNNKPFEEKNFERNKEAHDCMVSVPFNVTKQVRVNVNGRMSSKDNFHRTENVAPRTTRSLWGQYSDVKNRKKSNRCNQERNDANRIKKPFKQQIEEHVVRKDLFHKTDRKSAPSLNSATSTPRRLHSDVWNSNVSEELRNHHYQLNHILKMKPLKKLSPTASSVQHPVRLWSLEAVTPASDDQPQDCCEAKENIAPKSATKKLEEIMAQSSNRETSGRSDYFSCNMILMAAANTMVVFVLGAIQPICSYAKSKFPKMDINQRMNQCSCILTAVANAIIDVVFCAMHSLCENRKVVKDVIFRFLWRVIGVLCDLIKSAVSALKSIVAASIFHICATVRKDLKRDKASGVQDAHQPASSTENVANQSCIANSLTVKTEGIFPTPQQDRYSQFSDVLQNPTSKNDKQPAPQRTGFNLHAQTKKSQRRNIGQQKSRPLKEKVQFDASPTVGYAHLPVPGERQAKVSTKGKVKDEEALSSVLPSIEDEPVRPTVGRKRRNKKVAPATSVDLPVTTASVASKGYDKVMSRLVASSCVNVVARAKAHVQELRSPRVGLSNLLMPAKVSEESETSSPGNSDFKSSDEIQEVIERTVSRAKRRNAEFETTSTNDQASKSFLSQCEINMAVSKVPTEVMQNSFELTNILNITASVARPRANMKRKADGNIGTGLKNEPPVLDSARRKAQPATQKSNRAAVEQPELMEVAESVDKLFSITRPGEIVVCQEPSAANKLFTEQVQPASARFDAEVEIEDMETVQEQASVWNFFSFLASPFKFQPFEEEMELDERTVPVTPSNAEEEGMEAYEHPFEWLWPFEQQDNLKWKALAAGMRRSVAASRLSQKQAMEISQQQIQLNRPVASPSREVLDTKRPLPSTLGTFGERALPVKVMGTEQHMMQSVTQQQVMHPAVQSGMQPVTQPAMLPASQSVMQPFVQLLTQPVMQHITQPAMQSVIQPVLQPAMQRPLVQQSAQPNVGPKMPVPPKPIIDYGSVLEDNSAVKSKLNFEGSEGEPGVRELTATAQTPISEVIRQEATLKSRDQLIMEHLQVVPPPSTNPVCHLADQSDSDSEYDSDDEYELDLEDVLDKTKEDVERLEKLVAENDNAIYNLLQYRAIFPSEYQI